MARCSSPVLRYGVYPKGQTVTDWHGKVVGRIISKTCRKVRPGSRRDWISNEQCSYTVEIDGCKFVGRGRGDGISLTLRQKRGRGPGLLGAKKRKR